MTDKPTNDAEWRAKLTPEQYRILREAGTEAPFSGDLLNNKGKGMYRCAACGEPLFESGTKYDSGSGWPSFTAPAGARAHFGAVLVGAFDGDGLRYAGKVGTGFTVKTLAELAGRFRALARATPPFVDPPRARGVTWLEPRLVAQVGFMERTGDGRLRHPVFLGLRDDKAPAEVRWSAQTA